MRFAVQQERDSSRDIAEVIFTRAKLLEAIEICIL